MTDYRRVFYDYALNTSALWRAATLFRALWEMRGGPSGWDGGES